MREEKPNPEGLNIPEGKKGLAALKAAKSTKKPPPEAFGLEGCCVRECWAVVERDGTLVRGRNVWRTRRLATGIYEVVFTGDVSNGVFTATIGRPGISTEPCGMIGVALRCCLNSPETGKGVWVQTHDHKCRLADRSFHLMVHTQ